MTAIPDADARGWLASLARLIPVPAPYWRPDLDRTAVRTTLRCDDETLSLLVREGLPCEGPPGAERFDPYDVYNLGLYSGSGRSLPEYAGLFVGRLARADPATWVAPMTWRLRLRAECTAPDTCDGGNQWTVARLLPERYAGQVWELTGRPEPTITAGFLQMASKERCVEVSWGVSTCGVRREVFSPVARELMRWVVEDFRFQSLPPALATSPAQLRLLGAADCVGASMLIEEECSRLGIPARAERTLMLGVITFLSHGRLDFTDADGVAKALDPGLCAVSRLSGRRMTGFEEFCHGSTSNRMIPLAAAAGDSPFVRHGTDGRCPASAETYLSKEERSG